MSHDTYKPKTRPNATGSNPNAVSVRIEPKTMSKAQFQRRHDFRIGAQPAYVDGDLSHLNRYLMELRPLPDIQRENEALRRRAGRTRKLKSNAAVVTASIITFGCAAQNVFNRLPIKMQDRAFTELAQEIAVQLNTQLEALVVHLDETAIHAHFTLRAYTDSGEPISNATRLGDMAALQDLAAEVMQRYAPEIERGRKKKDRLQAGADYADTRHRTVKQLHEDLPLERNALEAEIADSEAKVAEQRASLEKTQRLLEKLEAKKELTEKEAKRQETYSRRLEKKQADMVAEMKALEARRSALEEAMRRVEAENEAVGMDRQKVKEEMAAVRRAKDTYKTEVSAIEAVLSEAENETLSYDPETERTTMKDPTPVRAAAPKLRKQITKLAKRFAFVEDKLFTRIFRLDAPIDRIRTFLSRPDIAQEARQEAEAIVRDAVEDGPGLG
ncbi:hypothetical protein [Pseudooctadecabacter jejudonensis]|uniref:hypothetical protein n=1 Tax=Pseudooctadecabacter jejudonensis TaxID=1391910 RepID=UPI00117A019A|nr:hypothetical protein [Pseudooctadecabacter jejudonensis]